MAGLKEPFTSQMFFGLQALIGPGNFSHDMFRFEQDGALISFMVAAERAEAERDGKKSGKAQGFISADFFQMAAKPFGTDIDTKNSLCQRTNLGNRALSEIGGTE